MNKDSVYLIQTDTTVGFLSNNDKKLAQTKKRPSSQKMLQVVDSFKTLKQQIRIPKKHRKLIRNSIKTTFIYPNGNSYRVIDKNMSHHNFIEKFGIMYSTSANITKNSFNLDYAVSNSDIVVESSKGFYESTPSKMFKISNRKIIKIR